MDVTVNGKAISESPAHVTIIVVLPAGVRSPRIEESLDGAGWSLDSSWTDGTGTTTLRMKPKTVKPKTAGCV